MVGVANPIRVLDGCRPDDIPFQELLAGGQPALLKGLIKDWGLVKAGLRSDQEAMQYLFSFYNGKSVSAAFGDPQFAGRLFYNEDFTELNFVNRRMPVNEVLQTIQTHLEDERPPAVYIASTLVDAHLPGFRQENDLPFAAHGFDPIVSVWIGNRTTASAHYDAPNNLACCAVGRRRFTVFPPEQIFNLYPGPLQLTPGGQAISVVDFANPDFEKYPRFREALAAGQSAELEPGDAVYIPAMWWHHVEGLSRFNTLVNYWWSTTPAFIPTPMNALYHALWSIRDRPEREKRAWQAVFEYYVFGPAEHAGEHLPERARDILGPLDDAQARQIRAMLIHYLNR
jgi:Cupin-like domain